MSKKIKRRLKRVVFGATLFVLAILVEHYELVSAYAFETIYQLLFFVAAYLVIGGDVVKKAVSNIFHGQVFDENFLMTIATIGAFLVSEYSEAVAVMLFYQVGEIFQSYAVNRSRKSIRELMDLRADYANVLREGQIVMVDPDEVSVGETIQIQPGEKIPLDGTIIKGYSQLDTKAITGESVPREVAVGELIYSGSVNITGVLLVCVEKDFGESTVSKIMELVENTSSRKAVAENFITKFSRYYTPAVVISALLLAIVPPLIQGGNFYEWLYRALTFLVISCPCALVISIPLTFFAGLGGASRKGVLVKGGNYLEVLAETEIVVLDKTGTLTKGSFEVVEIHPAQDTIILYNGSMQPVTEQILLELAAYGESYGAHPIGQSLIAAYGREIQKEQVDHVEVIPGQGLKVSVFNKKLAIGNLKLMEAEGLQVEKNNGSGTIIYLANEQQYLGSIRIADQLKDDSKEAILQLKQAGVKRIVMLTGDRAEAAKDVASKLGITEYYDELLPQQKVEKMEELLKLRSKNKKLLFVGDGINDAPVLAGSDIGVAMGGLGSDAAIEAADVVIMNDSLLKIPFAIRLSRKTIQIVKQNIVFAIGIKVFVLLLASIGFASMWAAVFADVGVAVLAILNAMRAMKIR
jgi:Zn2+/Cd2+-exporting ATPase